MPNCLECGAEIDHLRDYSPVWEEFKLTLGSNGHGSFEATGERVDIAGHIHEYDCPECGATLFSRYEDAIAFLKGDC